MPGHDRPEYAQLFRRVVFNVMAGHRDDHLRNHGFLLYSGGWRLAPAFDMTPHAQKDHHVLRLDDSDPHPSVATVLATHEFYRLTGARAGEITEEVAVVVDGWREAAQRHGLSRLELTEMEPAFSAHASYREGTERRPALRSPRGRRRP